MTAFLGVSRKLFCYCRSFESDDGMNKEISKQSFDEILADKKIYQIVNPRLVQAPPTISVKVAIDIMQSQRAGYIVIADRGKPVGIFTETDVVRKLLGKTVDWDRPVKEFMTLNPVCLRIRDTVGEAIDVMGKNRFYHIPLLDDKGYLVNVISVRTLIRFLAEFYPAEVLNLPPVPNQIMESAEGG